MESSSSFENRNSIHFFTFFFLSFFLFLLNRIEIEKKISIDDELNEIKKLRKKYVSFNGRKKENRAQSIGNSKSLKHIFLSD
jgi:hypothetical protein